MMSAQEMAVLLQAVQSGNMSRETFCASLHDAAWLPAT